MTPDEVLEQLAHQFGDGLGETEVKGAEVRLTTTPDNGWAVCRRLRELGFEYLNCLSGVDWTTHLEVVYNLSSLQHTNKIHLRVKVNRDAPALRTVSDLWPAANWHERECFDLFGIRFEGHPDHRRILLPEDWIGYPLRKDYADERLVPYTDYGLEEKAAKTEAAKGGAKEAKAAPPKPAAPTA
ncbi:MAG: NADH-quinone oxidoreductase subunit C [Zetaproteobacteria bacterium]|nr:MAG: NADH-quinone oxidoreductase subunit C [Zetaproteobacteria bacterium]